MDIQNLLHITALTRVHIYRKSENFQCSKIFGWPAIIRKLKARKFLDDEWLQSTDPLRCFAPSHIPRPLQQLDSLCYYNYFMLDQTASSSAMYFPVFSVDLL